ncbi:MAG: tetratricopeptide repeat protein [Planctomycetota bacterium]|jgi:tetratricopeptide (TPR) repeat protein
MVKKVCFAILVLFGSLFCDVPSRCFADVATQLEQAEQYKDDRYYEQAETIYKAIVAADPNTDEAFTVQEKLTCLYVAWAKQPKADAAYQELLAEYSGRPGIAKAVDHVADAYRKIGNFQKARRCSQYIVDQWPDGDHAAEAQAAVVRASILMGDEIGAQAGMSKLLTSFADSTHIAKAVDEVADDYYKAGQYEKARQWHQYVVDHWPQDQRALQAQKNVAILNTILGDQTAAEAALDKLVTDFSTHVKLPNLLYEMARDYEEVKEFNQAKEVYQRIVQVCPGTSQAGDSPLDVRKLDVYLLIESDRDDEVTSAVDRLIADYAAHPYVSVAVHKVAVHYHLKAYRLGNQGLESEASRCFRKAALIFERVMARFPGSDAVPRALRCAGDCYRKLGEYEESIRCYQKIVDDHPSFETAWNALFLVGRNYEDLKKSGAIAKSDADLKIKAAYEQLLEEYPSCPGARHARRWLSRYGTK